MDYIRYRQGEGCNLPILPWAIQQRIISEALTLPPYHPDPEDEPYGSGQAYTPERIRTRESERMRQRRQIQRAALTAMKVCKAWKKEAGRYLYAEPCLDVDNYVLFAKALLDGEKKWSDINLHPFSTPGRWVTTFDLVHVNRPGSDLNYSVFPKTTSEILSLMPCIRHIKMPHSWIIPYEDFIRAPFLARLHSIENLYVCPITDDMDEFHADEDPNVPFCLELLDKVPNLRILEIKGSGSFLPNVSDPPLFKLDKLHTLVAYDVPSGPVMSSLVASLLPSLRTLVIQAFHGSSVDLTHRLQDDHGEKIRSLIYLHASSRLQSIPRDTLELHPNLQHLGYHARMPFYPLTELLRGAPEEVKRECQLESVTVTKWRSSGSDVWDSDSMPRTWVRDLAEFKEFFESQSLPHLKTLRVEEFSWISPDLGPRALETGISGAMREWSEVLMRKAGVRLVDGDGRPAPVYDQFGRRRSIGKGGRPWIPADKLEEDGG